MALEKIKFQTNINVEVALKFAQGKLCDSQFGDPQYMFTTTDDRVFFVAEKVAQKIHGLKLQPREPFDITKTEVDGGNGRKWIEWRVAKVGFVPGIGEQPDGTFALPAPPVLIPNDTTEADLLRSIELVKARQRANQAAAGASTPAPVTTAPVPPAQPPYNNGNGSSKPQTKLSDALKTAVEAAHAAGEYAKSIGYAAMPQFTSEDLRTMANTLMIQNGGGR